MKYKEIFKLKKMLEKENIPFDWNENWGYDEKTVDQLKKVAPNIVDHYQICYPTFGEGRYMSIIEGFGTYGAEDDKLEVMGGFTKEETGGDTVIGWLTAEEVFDRIKSHYKKGE